jgi:hypothetical protein
MIEEIRRREPMEESVGWCFDRVRALISLAREKCGRSRKQRIGLTLVMETAFATEQADTDARAAPLSPAHKYLVRKEIDYPSSDSTTR